MERKYPKIYNLIIITIIRGPRLNFNNWTLWIKSQKINLKPY